MGKSSILAAAMLCLLCACGGAAAGAATGRQPAPQGTPATPELAPTAARSATPVPATPLPPRLTDLHNVSELQQRFDSDQGTPRLVLLFSPT